MNETVKVHFCQIDARDDWFCGYNPVALVVNERRPEELLNAHNGRLRYKLEFEYLSRLAALQQELKEKYEALADPANEGANSDPGVSSWDGSVLSQDEARAAKEEAQKLFPGPYAPFYT